MHNQLNVEVEFKYSGDNAPAVLQAQLCDPTPATTTAPTTGPATSPGETTPVPTTVVTTPVPDHCQDILSIVEIKDNWQCRACSRARFYAQVGLTINGSRIEGEPQSAYKNAWVDYQGQVQMQGS